MNSLWPEFIFPLQEFAKCVVKCSSHTSILSFLSLIKDTMAFKEQLEVM